MQKIIAGLEDVDCQMDDVLVFGDTHEQLEQRLEAVLKNIEDNGIRLNIEKCEFTKEKSQFLGYLIGKDGFEADPSKVEAITQMEAPTNISELRRFLRMVNQIGKYLPNLAQTNKPLRDPLSKDTAWIYGSAQKDAFGTIKRQLVSTPILAIYDLQLQTKVIADASSY